MKLKYGKNAKKFSFNDYDELIIGSTNSSLSDIMKLQLGYASKYLCAYKNVYIKYNTFIKYFEKITNINDVQIISDKLKCKGSLFKLKDYDVFIETDDYKEDVIGLFRMYFKYDDSKGITTACEIINENRYHESNASHVYLVLKTSSGLQFKKNKLNVSKINIKTMYNDDFKSVHKHIVNSLKNDSKGVLMLHGTAGTGKTNYIKYLTTLVPDKNFIFIPTSIVPFLSSPDFLEKLIEVKNSVLVLEDCEVFLRDRGNDGGNSLVSTLLNISDGILSDILNIQIICTFNTELDKIDDALLRKGRLIDEYRFNALEITKANKLLKKLKIDYITSEKMTLAEIFNFKDGSNRSKKKTVRSGSIGFK